MAHRRSTHVPTQGAVWGVAAAALLAIALRAPFWRQTAFPDEGGALLVVRHWRAGGPGLYGDLFFDRPPLLALIWRLADDLGGLEAARLLATGGVVVLVLAAGWAGAQVGHRRGAPWAACTAAALASTPLLGTQEVNGELLAAPLVMLSCAMTLAASRTAGRPVVRTLLALGAGGAGSAAVLVKQNLVDGLVFAVALTLAAGFTKAWPRGTVMRVAVPGAVGALVPLAATALWAATSGPGLHTLWYSMYGFREDASTVITTHSLSAPDRRLLVLAGISMASGLVPLVVAYLWLARSRFKEKEPFAVALLTMLVTGLAGVLLGESYWVHYLIALAPAAALAAGSLPLLPSGAGRWPRRAVVWVVVSATVGAVVAASPVYASYRSGERALIGWLAQARRVGDTALVAYGHPDIVEASGLETAHYRYLWSLPLRTEDPRLSLLRAAVSGKSAPSWIVEWIPFDSWGIDPRGSLAASVSTHYRQVATVCGIPVFLRDGIARAVPPVPSSC